MNILCGSLFYNTLKWRKITKEAILGSTVTMHRDVWRYTMAPKHGAMPTYEVNHWTGLGII